MARVLIPIPRRDFDPTETAVPWRVLTERGHEVVFATPDGSAGRADELMLTGEGLDLWGWVPLLRKITLVGGVLRAVVPAYDQFYDDYVQQSQYELMRVDLIREVCRFDAGKAILQDKGDNVCEKVIHYVVDSKFRLADLSFCSPLMYEKYLKRLEVRTPADLFFGKWQDGSGYEAAVLGALVYCSSILVGAIGESAFKTVRLKWSDPPIVKPISPLLKSTWSLLRSKGLSACFLFPKVARTQLLTGFCGMESNGSLCKSQSMLQRS